MYRTIIQTKNVFFISIFLLFFINSCQNNTNDNKSLRPNIVLIMLDDVGFENIDKYLGEVKTPNIDRMIDYGMTFTNAFTSSSACTPSRFTVLTGQYAGRTLSESFRKEHPPEEPYSIEWNTPIKEENLTLHKMLKNAGYYTGYVGKFHVGELEFDSPHNNRIIPQIDPDMDPYTNEADSLLKIYSSVISKRVQELTGADFVSSIQWENPENHPVKALRYHNLEWITEGAVDFIKSVKEDKPFFLHFNTTTLHGPNHDVSLKQDPHLTHSGRISNPYQYHPDRKTIYSRLEEEGLPVTDDLPDHIKHYRTGIKYMDDQIGVIFQQLEEYGLLENSLVILTADHNIEPGKSTVYDKGVRVPFIVFWKDKVPANSVNNNLVQFIDFLPTFAELSGTKIKSPERIDGISFANTLIKPTEKLGREFLFFEEGYTRGVRNDKFKYIAMRFPERILSKLKSGEINAVTHMGGTLHQFGLINQKYQPAYFEADQLYDILNDPLEQNNLAKDPAYSSQLKIMQNALSVYLDSFNNVFDLNANNYEKEEYYIRAVKNTIKEGPAKIYWWKRDIEYTPEKMGFLQN